MYLLFVLFLVWLLAIAIYTIYIQIHGNILVEWAGDKKKFCTLMLFWVKSMKMVVLGMVEIVHVIYVCIF